jgi:hypothetical protein
MRSSRIVKEGTSRARGLDLDIYPLHEDLSLSLEGVKDSFLSPAIRERSDAQHFNSFLVTNSHTLCSSCG